MLPKVIWKYCMLEFWRESESLKCNIEIVFHKRQVLLHCEVKDLDNYLVIKAMS